jgi:hypothetical protein
MCFMSSPMSTPAASLATSSTLLAYHMAMLLP